MILNLSKFLPKKQTVIWSCLRSNIDIKKLLSNESSYNKISELNIISCLKNHLQTLEP